MLKIKKSGSGLQLTKINKFNNLRNGYAFNKNYEKVSHIEFEIERQKEVMVKLKLDIRNKTKELNELISKNQEEKNKTKKKIQLIEEILKMHKTKTESKTNPKLKIETEIDDNIINTKIKELKEKENDLLPNNNNTNTNTNNEENETYNKTNTKTFYTTNNNFVNKNNILPKIKSPKFKTNLFINTNPFMKKKKLKDVLYMTTLRNKISTLNEKLTKKKEEISDYKEKSGKENYSDLENDLLSVCDKIKELKYKNAKMCADLEDFAENYFFQREENIKLKNKLNDFINTFNNYKENTEKNNIILEKKLKYFGEKNLECIIYHLNIGKNTSKNIDDNRSKLTEAENIIEKINEELEEINNEMKLKDNNLNIYKNEIENLNNKKKEIEENMQKNIDNINNMNIKKEESDKKNKEKENMNKQLKKELKEKKNKYKNITNKITEVKESIKQKDEEIIKLKEEIEKLKVSKKVFYY